MTTVFPTNYAIGITTADKEVIIIHMGLNTVKLKGMGFGLPIEIGQKVKVGQKIAKMTLTEIQAEGCKTDVLVLLTLDSASTNIKLLCKPSSKVK